jgi:hypothetical protein
MLAKDRLLFLLFTATLSVFIWYSPQARAQSQQSDNSRESDPARNSISLHMVGTVGNGSLQGTTMDRRLFLLGAAYNRLLSSKKLADISFTSQLTPVAILREPYVIGSDIQSLRSFPPGTQFHKNFGAGANPAGIRVNFLPGKKVQPFFGIQGGFLRFSHTALAPTASHFNFTIDGRAGLEFSLRSEKAILFAYMFQHMSNAYIAAENPGVDSHMLTLAYRFPLQLRKKATERNRAK